MWLSIAIVTGSIEPRFWSLANLQNLVRQIAPLQILAAGQLFAVLSGGLDLSVASVMALSGVIGILVTQHIGGPAGLLVMALLGLLFGCINGAIIVGFSVSPLIATLGMMSVAKGLALLLTGGLPLYDVPDWVSNRIGFGTIWSIPASSIIAFGVMLVGLVILRKTVFGRRVYAVGSNRSGARNSGVRVQSVTFAVYA